MNNLQVMLFIEINSSYVFKTNALKTEYITNELLVVKFILGRTTLMVLK